MAKEIKTLVLIAITAIMSVFVVSCDKDNESTYVGFEEVYNYPKERKYEYLDYQMELDTLVNKLYTVEQKVTGHVAEYQGNEMLDGKAFEYDLNLEALFDADPKQVYVLNKENLSNVMVTSTQATQDTVENSMDAKGFKRSTVKKNYEFFFNEGERVSASTMYQSISHRDTTFKYAKIKTVSFNKSESRINEAISNADSTVCDVDLYFTVEVECVGESELNSNYAVRVPVVRIYKELPADAVTTLEDIAHAAEFATRVNELYTVAQEVTGAYVTRQRDEEIGRKEFKYDLDLNVLFNINPDVVKVDAEDKLTDVALKTTNASEPKVTTEAKEDFVMTTTSRSYTFNFNDGEVVTANSSYQGLATTNGELMGVTEIKSVTYKKYETKLNNAMSNADRIVYDVTMYFDVEVTSTTNSSISAVYTVPVSYQRVYEPEKIDTYETVMENTKYEGEFNTKVNELYTVKQQVDGEFVTYKNNVEEVSREGFERAFNLEALFEVPEVVYVATEQQLSEVSLAGSSKSGDTENKQTNNGFTTITRSLNYGFKFNESEIVVSEVAYQREKYGTETLAYTSIENVSYKKYEAKKNEAKSNADSTVYDVKLYFDVKLKRQGVVDTKSTPSEETHLVEVPYTRVYMHVAPKDELTGKRAENVQRTIVDERTEEISWTEVETWSVSGEKTSSMSYRLYRNFNEPSLQWVYTTNTNYVTSSVGKNYLSESTSKDGNWTVTTRYEEYVSVADNGVNAFNNVYTYDYQKAVYENEYYRINIDYAEWNFAEGASDVVSTSNVTEHNGAVYNVSDYTNNVTATYSITTDSYNHMGVAKAKIAVEKPIDPIIPANWGRIVGAGISAVPADDVSGGDYAKKCLCIRTENGAVSIVFDMASTVPGVDMILSGYFAEGSFGSEYNSGYYTTSTNKGSYPVAKWVPGIAKDLSDRIAYYDGDACKRNIRNTTLQMWNWRDGNLSTVIDGYSFSVSNDGTLTVKYNGAIAMQIR